VNIPPRLVIFDCDGVLVDSEPIAARIVAAEVTALGWPMAAEESHAAFLGMSLSDMRPVIARRIGREVPAEWVERLADRLVVALADEVEPMQGVPEVLHATSALGLPWRIASNSSHAELEAKFGRVGLTELVAGKVHSASDVIARGGRGKPAPDLFLAAAAAGGAAPAECLVVEDSATGAQAARAAGMRCLGFAPHGDGAPLAALGARVFRDLGDLPGIISRDYLA
jgi:HAD superfamily hydrolase (TIGR01509 family)